MSVTAQDRLHHPSLPEGQLLYAVGDIHGRSDVLRQLLEAIAADAASATGVERRTLVFLGDYVDRGPDSKGVIDMLLKELPERFDANFLKGNHEALLLGFLYGATPLEHWLINGGEATMASYGVDVSGLADSRASEEDWRSAFRDALPAAHLAFFKRLELIFPAGDYLFVHAGLRPGVPLSAQREADLIWIREPFLDHTGSFGKIIVHGHTPAREPDTRSNRIGIDTGACFTGRLTALRLQGNSRRFLQT
ncbi:metallophosphoesterase family protein [Methyloceanibacter sp.]|uniref:metallophosphoesterase family protein n=1 Tax=Methyloceanibacter sp. TaxID=1965321 RepID=UPI002D327FEE|nr:metallophosphoesterase family protein [Methyloceanibacter sp.]HZP08816.1 metallophosphoesterase family protein [Methyloceanibacter sp.]